MFILYRLLLNSVDICSCARYPHQRPAKRWEEIEHVNSILNPRKTLPGLALRFQGTVLTPILGT